MIDIPPNAKDLRSDSLCRDVVFEEVNDITSAIMTAVRNCHLEVQVFDTFMTSTSSIGQGDCYYAVWQGQLDDRVKELQMEEVISTFREKGFSIARKLNPLTQSTFMWEIKW